MLPKGFSVTSLLVCLALCGSAAAYGDVPWQHELTDATADSVAVAGDAVVLLHEGQAVALGVESGAELWEVPGSFDLVATADEVAYLATSEGVQARNARDGALLWQLSSPVPEGSTLSVVGDLLLHLRPGQVSPSIRAFERHSGDEVWTWFGADAEVGNPRSLRLRADRKAVIVGATVSGAYTVTRFTALDLLTGRELWSVLGDRLFRWAGRGWVVAALAPNPHLPRMLLVDELSDEVSRWPIDLIRRPECGAGKPVGATRAVGLAADFLWLEVDDACGKFLQRTSLNMPASASEVTFASEAGDAFVPTNLQSHLLLQREVNQGTDRGGREALLLDLASMMMTALPAEIRHADRAWLLSDALAVGAGEMLSVISLQGVTLQQQRFFTSDWDIIGLTRTVLVVRVGNQVVALHVVVSGSVSAKGRAYVSITDSAGSRLLS